MKPRKPSPLYGPMIGRAIGTDDPETIACVEAYMRGDHGTLDGLGSAARFDAVARSCYETVLFDPAMASRVADSWGL